MSYPQQVPEGWTKGDAVRVVGTGPRFAIARDLPIHQPIKKDEFMITFDTRADAEAWLKWWKS